MISNPQTTQRMVEGEDPRPGPHHTVHEREVKVQDLGNNSTVQYSRPPPRVHRARLHFAAVPRLPLPSAAPVTWREGGVGGGARSARAMPPASAFSPLLAAEEEGGAADPAGRSSGGAGTRRGRRRGGAGTRRGGAGVPWGRCRGARRGPVRRAGCNKGEGVRGGSGRRVGGDSTSLTS